MARQEAAGLYGVPVEVMEKVINESNVVLCGGSVLLMFCSLPS